MYSLKYLESLPTIEVWHTDNLKISTNEIKVYLSRLTVDDGETCNNKVTVKVFNLENSSWEIVKQYQAK